MSSSMDIDPPATAASSSAPTPAAARSSPAPSSAAASVPSTNTTVPVPAPAPSPQPNPADEAEEDALINDNFDEDDLTDVKPDKRKKKSAAPTAGPIGADALDRLNELLQRTEQFAKFVPTKAEAKKGRGRAGRHHERAEEEEEDKELVNDELQQDGKQSWPDHLDEQPSSVVKAGGLPMRDYQLEALNWLIKLHDQNLNGILADEMGLGKTLESLSLLAYLKQYRNYGGPHLIIVPKSTSSNWMREVNRWTNNLKAFKFHGTQEERDAQKPLLAQNDICISTYEMIIREKGWFAKQKFKYLYIDEAHRIKNENSLLSRVVRTFQTEHRLLITGTPLQNNLHELWALLNFLVPQLFHSSDDFAEWFNVEDPSMRGEIVARLHRLLRPFLLRRLKSDVEKALLPKIETKLFVGMSAMQKALYKKILERDIEVLNATSTAKMKLLNIVMQLRKVCCHPYLFTGQEPGPPYIEGEHIIENSSKMVLLDKLLTKLKANGNRVLIFSQMTRILDILEDFCRYRGHSYNRIDGQTKQDERDEAMEEYNAPNSKKFVFLLSTRAGGLGINLQTADTVILFDSDWNPQMDLQAMDRAHRIGQKKQVTVFRFVVEHSIEQKMVERATKKLFLDALVVRQGRLNDSEKSVTSQELQDMVRFGANRIFSGADEELTDADIDLILSRGSEMTRMETEKLKQNAGNDLLNFSLTDQNTNFQMFEGKDYRGFRAHGGAGFDFIEPAKRERKSNYDINQYYREALRVGDKKAPRQQREWKPTQRFDYQFFNVPRLDELEKKDHESRRILQDMKNAKRKVAREEKRIREEREKEERRKARYQRMREQRRAEAAAAGTTLVEPQPGEEDKDMGGDSDDDAPATSATPAPSPSPAVTGDQPVKMEIDEDEIGKKEVTPPAAAAAASSNAPKTESSVKDEDVVMKTEDTESSDATGRKTNRSRLGVKKDGASEASASPAPSPMPNAAQPDDDEGDDEPSDAAEEAEMMEKAGCLTLEEQAELKRLQEEGFATWSRRHITSFIKAMEKFGRNDLANVKQHVDEKKPEEVEAYYYAFWKNYHLIKDSDKMIKQIERGEQRLQKQKTLQAVIDQKVKKYRGNFEKMTIPYPTSTQKTFTEEEDKFMIVQLHRLGYGNWEDLKSAIRSSWMFRFDWYIKSRTCGELSKRVEYLLKLLEKEQSEWEEKQASAVAKKSAKVLKAAQAAMASSAAVVAGSSPVKPKKPKDDSSSTKKKDKDSSSSTKERSKEKKQKIDKGEKSEKSKEKESKKKEKSSVGDDVKKERKEKKRKEPSDSTDGEKNEQPKTKKLKTETPTPVKTEVKTEAAQP